MALVIDLKPTERIIIGTTLITNDSGHSSRLRIEGDAPIMREKDIMRENEANTPCKKVYLTIQLMYLADDPAPLHAPYFEQIRDIMKAAPSTTPFFTKINDHLMDNAYYKALKEARNLVKYEEELLAHAQ